MASPSLTDTLETIWQLLGRGVADRRHGFHWPVVCTLHDGQAHGRVVVFRGTERASRRLWFHTDARSAKLDQLEGLSWVFYDPGAKRQLRVSGPTARADDALADDQWARLPLTSRKTYLVSPGPGTSLGDTWDSGLPAALGTDPPSREASEAGRANFAVVVTEAVRIESLHLARRGHERAVFDWDGAWHGEWRVP